MLATLPLYAIRHFRHFDLLLIFRLPLHASLIFAAILLMRRY